MTYFEITHRQVRIYPQIRCVSGSFLPDKAEIKGILTLAICYGQV